jgi:hypothetical protein
MAHFLTAAGVIFALSLWLWLHSDKGEPARYLLQSSMMCGGAAIVGGLTILLLS